MGEEGTEEQETYSLIFKSLKHPIRRRILRMLADRHWEETYQKPHYYYGVAGFLIASICLALMLVLWILTKRKP